jgi:predicted transposase YdaD
MAGTPFDATLKDMVECGPDDWPTLALLPPGPTRVIDADISTVSGAGDKALLVETKPPYLLHLEFFAGHDAANQPILLHKRNLLLEDRHRLLVRTVAVVLRPEADSPQLSGLRQCMFPGETEAYHFFRYQVLRVWQIPPDTFLAGGLGLVPLAPIGAVTEGELPGIIKRIEKRLRAPRSRPMAPKIWAATYILMGLRYSAAVAGMLLRGVVSMKESTTYQAILQEGLEEGRKEGALTEARRALLIMGEHRLGVPDQHTRSALERIQMIERLEELMGRAGEVASWQELFERPVRRRPNGRRRSS